MKRLFKYKKSLFLIMLILSLSSYLFCQQIYAYFLVDTDKVGVVVDEFNGVKVYYNGHVGNVSGRNTSKDGYNLGLKYQCVEFIKRYYYERFDHKMPDSYGHAKDFFDDSIADGKINPKRNLLQYHNGSGSKPQVEDIFLHIDFVY